MMEHDSDQPVAVEESASSSSPPSAHDPDEDDYIDADGLDDLTGDEEDDEEDECWEEAGSTSLPSKGKVAKRPRLWTEEENELLRQAVLKYQGKNWKKIAEAVPNRNSVQCLQHWKHVLHPEVGKGSWTPEEDARLVELVELYGKRWSEIAKHLPRRIGKRCRERFMNHLSPELRKDPWSEEEEHVLLEARNGLGNRWTEIAKLLPGRGVNQVKNHWYSMSRRRRASQRLALQLASSSSPSMIIQSCKDEAMARCGNLSEGEGGVTQDDDRGHGGDRQDECWDLTKEVDEGKRSMRLEGGVTTSSKSTKDDGKIDWNDPILNRQLYENSALPALAAAAFELLAQAGEDDDDASTIEDEDISVCSGERSVKSQQDGRPTHRFRLNADEEEEEKDYLPHGERTREQEYVSWRSRHPRDKGPTTAASSSSSSLYRTHQLKRGLPYPAASLSRQASGHKASMPSSSRLDLTQGSLSPRPLSPSSSSSSSSSIPSALSALSTLSALYGSSSSSSSSSITSMESKSSSSPTIPVGSKRKAPCPPSTALTPGMDDKAPRWSAQEDAMLKGLVARYHCPGLDLAQPQDAESKRWSYIASHFPGRTSLQVLQHWQHVVNPSIIKGKGSWTKEEDNILREKIAEYGCKWSKVAEFLHRTGKQVRERWLNHLDPKLKKGSMWTAEEEEVLLKAHTIYRNRWASIAKLLPGRSDNDVKNHWYSSIQRKYGVLDGQQAKDRSGGIGSGGGDGHDPMEELPAAAVRPGPSEVVVSSMAMV